MGFVQRALASRLSCASKTMTDDDFLRLFTPKTSSFMRFGSPPGFSPSQPATTIRFLTPTAAWRRDDFNERVANTPMIIWEKSILWAIRIWALISMLDYLTHRGIPKQVMLPNWMIKYGSYRSSKLSTGDVIPSFSLLCPYGYARSFASFAFGCVHEFRPLMEVGWSVHSSSALTRFCSSGWFSEDD